MPGPTRRFNAQTAALLLGAAGFLAVPKISFAKEIKVSLFNQPCTLSGPFNESMLQAVHAISPERIPAQQSISSVKNALAQVRQTKDLPPELQTYQGRLTRRLNAQFQFLELLVALKKNGDLKFFLEASSPLLTASGPGPFRTIVENEAKKVPPRKWGKENISSITEVFENGIEPYPEEEFHRTIERARIHYGCSFDESEPHSAPSNAN